jgi:hypothetical protein
VVMCERKGGTNFFCDSVRLQCVGVLAVLSCLQEWTLAYQFGKYFRQ